MVAAAPATQPATQPAPYLGKFEYRYPGFVVHVEVHDAKHLKWTTNMNGQTQSEEVTVERRTITPGVEVLSWTEASGAMAVQTADFNAMKLVTTLIVNGQRTVFEGKIVRVAE